VSGVCSRTGVLQHWIRKQRDPVKALVYESSVPDSKKAELSYRLLDTQQKGSTPYSLVEVHLQTGRPHQIRAQFAYIDHPIVGDLKYGSVISNQPVHLRSVRLECTHPQSEALISIESYPSSEHFWSLFI
jgi:23S rRNA pseudouridine1911/1915/1917 synthase